MSKEFHLKIDSHQHFWKYDPDRYSWLDGPFNPLRKDFLPNDLEPLLFAQDFDGCIAVQAAQDEEETKFLLELAANYNFIKGVVGWLDMNSPNYYNTLQLYAANPYFKGLRHVVYDKQGDFFLDPVFQRSIAQLQEFKLTFDLLAFNYQLPGAIQLAHKFPEQAFVLDHLGKPKISNGLSQAWVQNIKELASCSNVYCKLSGLVTETDNFEWKKKDFNPFLDVVFKAFGEDRLMFGSDWPVCFAAGSYEDVIDIVKDYTNKSSNAAAKIFGGNAAKFYRL